MAIEFELVARVDWDPRLGKFVARHEEYPHITGEGPTPGEAAEMLRSGIVKWLKMLKNQAIPFYRP